MAKAAKRRAPPPKRAAKAKTKRPVTDKVRLERLQREQAELLDAPIDDSMLQRQRLADIRSRIYTVMARIAKKASEKVAYERIANEAGTEARQSAKNSNIDRVLLLLRQRDEELEIAGAFQALSRRRA